MSSETLFDLQELLEQPRNADVTKAMMTKAADRLLSQQFLHRNDYGAAPVYDLLLRHKGYFEDLFDALGRKMVIISRELMIELWPLDSHGRKILTADETVLLLALRYSFETGVEAINQVHFGHVETSSLEVMERFDQFARSRPPFGRVRAILNSFQRAGFIEIGDEIPYESGVHLTIRPSIRRVTGEGWSDRFDEWLTHGEERARMKAQERPSSPDPEQGLTQSQTIADRQFSSSEGEQSA